MSQRTPPQLIDLLVDADRITLITLYELDQLNPRAPFSSSPTFPDYAITAALRAHGRIRVAHRGKLFKPGHPPEELQRAVFRHMVDGGIPSLVSTGSGVFMRSEPELHNSIAAALNNLTDFDLARRSERECFPFNSALRWVLPGGKVLTGECEHAKHSKEGTGPNRKAGEVASWIVSLTFENSLVYWHAQLGKSLPEPRYSIEPSGKFVARALLKLYGGSLSPVDVGVPAESTQPADVKTTREADTPSNEKLLPSRVKALAAYEWAIERIEDADKMPIRELHNRLLKKLDDLIEWAPPGAGEVEKLQEFRDSLPGNSETFGKYLRDAGLKRYNAQGDRIHKISHFKRQKEL